MNASALDNALRRFEQSLVASGAPAARRMRPGLPDAGATALEDFGPDLAALYRWRDGVEPADEVLRPSEATELCHVMPGLYFDGLWWMPAQRAVEGHVRRRMSVDEWLLMDGEYEHVTYTKLGQVVAWCPEDGLHTRFPTLESFFDLAAEAWEVGVFTWRTAPDEDFGGLLECDRPRLDLMVSQRRGVLRDPMP